MVKPVNLSPPYVSGSATVGSTLSCSQGSWAGSPTSLAYQWRIDSQAIDNESSSSTTLPAVAQGGTVDCAVTASNVDGSTTVISNSVGPITGPEGGEDGVAETGQTAPEEQRERAAEIEAMGVEAWKEANDERPPDQRGPPASWQTSTRNTPPARTYQNPSASR